MVPRQLQAVACLELSIVVSSKIRLWIYPWPDSWGRRHGTSGIPGMAGKLDCLCGRASAFLFFFLSELGAGVAILPHRSASDFLGRQLMNISFAPLSPLVSTKSVANKTADHKTSNTSNAQREKETAIPPVETFFSVCYGLLDLMLHSLDQDGTRHP